MSGRVRNFVWTLHSWTADEIAHIKSHLDQFSYIVWGEELTLKGIPHLQGYAECASQMRFSTIKKLIADRVHVELRKGTSYEAAGYCLKGKEQADDYSKFFYEPSPTWVGFQHGTITQQGKRSDITAPVELLREGATLKRVAQEFPEQFVKYHKGFTALRAHLLPPRSLDDMPEVIVRWGATGTGKTRAAYTEDWPELDHYVWKPSNGNWWDGYDGQPKIILDEFRGNMPWVDLLALLDRNEHRVHVKGAMSQIQAYKFVITSPMPPSEWYRDDDRYDKLSQLTRRITRVIEHKVLAA